MTNIPKLCEKFKANYEFFLTGCDSMRRSGAWDRDENGDMDTYYSEDLVSVIIRLVAADGDVTEDEAAFMEDSFGMEYTPEELSDFYEACAYELDEENDAIFADTLATLNTLNPRLAEAYKFLVSTACEIILDSDIKPEEDLNIVKHVYDLMQ